MTDNITLEDIINDNLEQLVQDNFNELFKMSIQGMDNATIASALKISRPTINNWREGRSAPHPLGRFSVFVALYELKERTRLCNGT